MILWVVGLLLGDLLLGLSRESISKCRFSLDSFNDLIALAIIDRYFEGKKVNFFFQVTKSHTVILRPTKQKMDKRKYKSETNQYSDSGGLCPCCNVVLPKATYYRHLINMKSALNSEEISIEYLQSKFSDDSDDILKSSKSSNSESPPISDINFNESDYDSDNATDRNKIWKPSSAKDLQLLRFLKIKLNHNFNDKGFIEMLQEAGFTETIKSIRTKLASDKLFRFSKTSWYCSVW